MLSIFIMLYTKLHKGFVFNFFIIKKKYYNKMETIKPKMSKLVFKYGKYKGLSYDEVFDKLVLLMMQD